MAHDVFISYSSQDKAVADAVCATLEGRKIRCWIAPRDVLAGQPYAESILNGINKSRVFVLVFSSDSNLSQQVLREVERAVSKGIPILPFRIADVTPT
ncbi:MAG: toll/interleukin-1 receptor domain-containing protein, partial [Dehalococcoidales bacterium]